MSISANKNNRKNKHTKTIIFRYYCITIRYANFGKKVDAETLLLTEPEQHLKAKRMKIPLIEKVWLN